MLRVSKGVWRSTLADFLVATGKSRCVVLTGAGCSTESGIPDYRGPCGRYRHKEFVPVVFQKFIKHETERKRYWARSMLGYQQMLGVSCNGAHHTLHEMVQRGVVSHLVTQNVDGLHHLVTHGGVRDPSDEGYRKYTTSPPSYPFTELHGNIHLVTCVGCGDITPRVSLQHRLLEANSDLVKGESFHSRYSPQSHSIRMTRPDGDYHLAGEMEQMMNVVNCARCEGLLKPHVVLFGENVNSKIVEQIFTSIRNANSLLCIGTSLQVFSAYRFVLMAKQHHVPVAVVNAGMTRADDLVDLKVHTERLSVTLQEALHELY